MRLNSTIHLRADVFPSDYRRIFIHLLKEAFKETEFEDLVLKDGLPKPYTFSVGFSKISSLDSSTIHFDGVLFFDFSSYLHTMIAHLYNHLRFLERLHKFEVVSIRIDLPRPAVFGKGVVIFKTLGHMVLTNENGYVGPDGDIEEAISHSLSTRLSVLKESFPEWNFPEFSWVRLLDHNLKGGMVRHYGGFIRTLRGTLKVEAPPEILAFMNDAGIGVRTGQGFGMVKVVREWRS